MAVAASALARIRPKRALTKRTDSAKTSNRGAWNSCSTDPAQHNSTTNWRYLVHAIMEPKDLTEIIKAALVHMNVDPSNHGKPSPDIASGKATIEALLQEKITGRALSCSMIDKNQTGIWGAGQGVILRIEEDVQVIATGTKDLGSHAYSLDLVKRQFAKATLLSPDQLLRKTTGRYNEVVIGGENPGRVKVLGVVINVDSKGNPKNDYGLQLMRKAQSEGLPTVLIGPQT